MLHGIVSCGRTQASKNRDKKKQPVAAGGDGDLGGGMDGPALARKGAPPELVCSSCEDEWHAVCLGPEAAAAATTASLEGRPFLCPR